jgi:pyruvate dehydrogenase E1 component alpha subunit
VTYFETELANAKIATADDFRKIKDEVEKEVEEVIEYADQSPNPDLSELHRYVYAGEWEARG